MLTGSGGGAPIGVAGGASKIAHARKAYQALKKGSSLYTQAMKGGAGAKKATNLAIKQQAIAAKWWKKAGISEREVLGSGILQKVSFPMQVAKKYDVTGYTDWLLKIGTEKSWVNALPIIKNASGAKIAKTVDLGIRNLGAFALYGQAKTPYSSSLTERLQTLSADAASAAIFTVAGMPRIAGFEKFAKTASRGTKIQAHTVEFATLVGVGMGAGDVGGAAARLAGADVPPITWEERIIHGLALATFHYARAGYDRVNIRDRVKSGLRGMGVDEELIAKWMPAQDKLLNSLWESKHDPRIAAEQNRFVGRKKGKGGRFEMVDLLGIFKPGLETEKFTLVYQDIGTGERKVVRGIDKNGLAKDFFKKFKRFKIKDKSGKLTEAEKKIKKPPKKVIDEVEKAIVKRRALAKASKRERYSEVTEKKEPLLKDRAFKRTKDFDTEGTYSGVVNGREFKIFKDTTGGGLKGWHDSESGRLLSTKTKKDAIEQLKINPPKPGEKYSYPGIVKDEIRTKKAQAKIKPEYELKLFTAKEGESPTTKHGETIFELEPGKGMVFKDKESAQKFAQEKWNSESETSQPFIESMEKKSGTLSKMMKDNAEWTAYRNMQKDSRVAEKRLHLTADEIIFFRKGVSPYGRGKLDNMSPAELETYHKMLTPDKDIFEIKEISYKMHSDDFINKTFDSVMQSKMWLGKMFLPFTTMLRTLKSSAMNQLAKMVDMHELERQRLAASGTVLREELMRKYDLDKDTFRELGPFLDSKYKQFKNKKLEAKLGKDTIEAIKKDFETFSDDIFIEMVDAGVEVRKRFGGESAVWEPLFSVKDKNGNKIKLHSSIFFKDPAKPELKRGHAIFDVIARRKKTIMNEKGQMVDVGEIKHNYVKTYTTRIISDGMKKFMGRDDFKMFLAREMIRTDEYLKSLLVSGMSKKKVIAVARSQINDLAKYMDNQLPLGTVFARTANLPPVLLINENNTVIRMQSKANLNVKAGDTVRDANNRSHTVKKVVDVYERDLGKILDRYIGSISQVIPTYRFFGRDGADSKHTKRLIDMAIGDLQGSKETDWAHTYIRAKINGTPRSLIAKGLNPFTHGVAWMGLSSPFSGVKNVLLGGTQNVSTFGLVNFTNGWGNFLANDVLAYIGVPGKRAVYKELATKIGALQIGVHEMLGAKGWDFSIGGMKQTEHLNRYVTVAMGDVVLQHAVERLAFPKNASTLSKLSMSTSRAAHLMKNLFGFSEAETARIIRRVREYSPPKNTEFDMKHTLYEVFQSPEGIRNNWRSRALQNSHLKTQGGPSLSTLPAWMSKDWAKPMSLFYRIAYNVTNNIVNNVMKPLHVDGNPFPMLRYTAGATASGAAMYSLYNLVLGRDMINKFKGKDSEYWNYFFRGEGLGVISNAFDEYGGVFDSFFPAVVRAGESIYNEVSSVAAQAKTPLQGIHDFAKNNVVVYTHGLEAAHSIGTKIGSKNLSSGQLTKLRKEERRRQGHFEEAFFKDKPKFDANQTYLTERSPYYRAVSETFWTGDDRSKAQAYYSALMYIVHDIEKNAPYGMTGRMTLIKNAKAELDSIISRQRIMPQSWGKRDRGESISRRLLYLNKLTPAEHREFRLLEGYYRQMNINWKRALQRYKSEMYFPHD